MKALLLGAAFAVGLAALEGDASAGLTAELSVRAGTAHAGRTLAKAKKKKRSGAASSGKSDSDDAGSTDDDAAGKSASASSGGGDDASQEDELLGSKKKTAARADAGGESGGGATSDGGDAPRASGKSVETVAAAASPEESGTPSSLSALEMGIGAKALFRNLAWTSDASAAGCSPCLGPYALTPGPETGLWLEFYPAALGTSGFAANVGLVGSFDYGFGVATTLANKDVVATKFRDLLVGLKVRLPLGTFVPNLTVSYGQQVFEVAPQNPMRDIPQVAYSFVRPALGTRVLLAPTVALDASAGYLLVLDPGSGANHIRAAFPDATSFGFDVSASVAFRVIGAIGVRAGADFREYVLNMNDKTQPTIGGAVDRYITAWAGVEVVLDGQGAAAGGDDEPAKTSKRKRRHAEPASDDADADGDSSKSEAD